MSEIIQITYPNGKIKNLDKLPDNTFDRRLLAASFMTVEEMIIFLKGTEARDICRLLKLPIGATERVCCQTIFDNFWKK